MDNEVMLALTQVWWSWNTPSIHKALSIALLDHWLPKAENVLRGNAAAGGRPTGWDDLTALRRNPRNVRRVVQGESATSAGFLLGIAAILQLETRDVYPDTADWIARAATHLSRCPLSEEDCRSYASFVLQQPLNGKGYCLTDVEEALQAVSREVREAVLTVAQQIEPALKKADRTLRKREG